ncbi:hypothetical protein [Ramlibacter sp. PS4R-6]|uniref:hypothetical protein n=1 Tax=Ramlibacter sp. PS4R-6 TaxID=3133438 RepID=UPI0030B27ED1
MNSKPGQAFEAWRSADSAARSAEQRLQEAWSNYAQGLAAPPPNELIQEVAQLRKVAHERLTAAIAVIGTEAHDNRSSKPGPRTERPSSR